MVNTMDPTHGYIDTLYWIPKAFVQAAPLRACTSMLKEDGTALFNYIETEHHIGVGREFSLLPKPTYPIINRTKRQYDTINWNCVAQCRNLSEEQAWSAFERARCGVLQLACGKGKTVQALRKIAESKAPGLVVVPTLDLMGQWIERAVEWLTLDGRSLLAAEDIGIVQGSNRQWDRPLVIATAQTLINCDPHVPEHQRFKTLIVDECHHLKGDAWIRIARFSYGDRFGLSATPDDESGLHEMYYQHIGKVFHTDLEQPLTPRAYFCFMPVTYDLKAKEVLDKAGKLSLSKLWGAMAYVEQRNAFILEEVHKALANGRKILVLSHSRDHCILLHTITPGSGLCVQGVPSKQRRAYLKDCQVTFATTHLGKEGLDQTDLDTVFMLFPLKKKGVIQQIMGRIQRPGGLHPVILFFIDTGVPPTMRLHRHIRRHLESWLVPIHQFTKEVKDVARRERGGVA